MSELDLVKMSVNSAPIRKISVYDSQRISCAQVIQSLSTALRQLIDNSLDAEATVIDIRCENNGYDSLVVEDNGFGIGKENFANLCKPHSTSKLKDFEELMSLNTLGFRGEALNALATLGKVTITTRAADSPIGTCLKFDGDEIIEQVEIARQIGTTVKIDELFYSLPVRRQEFERIQKRELLRLVNVIQEFALLHSNVKFLFNNTINGKQSKLIATPGTTTSNLRDVFVSLFGGSSDRTQVLAVDWDGKIDEDVAHEHSIEPIDIDFIKLTGYISSFVRGNGRSAADRQFLYVNNRPVDLPKLCRAINAIYQSHNKGQFPTFVLRIEVPTDWIEVNVTPDKRTIFFKDEKLMIVAVKSAIVSTFRPLLGTQESCSGTQIANAATNITNSPKPIGVPSIFDILKDTTAQSRKRPMRDFYAQVKQAKSDSGAVNTQKNDMASILSKFQFNNSCGSPGLGNGSSRPTQLPTKRPSPRMIKPLSPHIVDEGSQSSSFLNEILSMNLPDSQRNDSNIVDDSFYQEESSSMNIADNQQNVSNMINDTFDQGEALSRESVNSQINDSNIVNESFDQGTALSGETADRQQNESNIINDSYYQREVVSSKPPDSEQNESSVIDETFEEVLALNEEEDNSSSSQRFRTLQKVSFDEDAFFARLEAIKLKEIEESSISDRFERAFQAGISPDDSTNAERELDQAICRTDFANMRVLGQFNRGFIITQLESHLFIVDQHAADEKFNFERFQKTARVGTQKMMTPQLLDVGAVAETALAENTHIFEANDGARLVSLPVLTKYIFDRTDVDEILTAVMEHPGQMYRPQKLRRIFASRACRTSIMVGDPLNEAKMEKIVRNLGELDHPWNCPHGRPTLRHLVDLKKIGF